MSAVNFKKETIFHGYYQLSLGELIERIEKAGTTNEKGEPKTVYFDFGSAVPTIMQSWRGSYYELALGYTLTGYDAPHDHFKQRLATELLQELKETIGKEFTGWKGGEFTMSKDTPIWVNNPGNSGNTAIVAVKDGGYCLYLITAFCEF